MPSDFQKSLKRLADARAQDYRNTRIGLGKTNTGFMADESYKRTEKLPIDDGLPPPPPAALEAIPLAKALRVEWSAPEVDDFVTHTEVSITREGNPPLTLNSAANWVEFHGLEPGAPGYSYTVTHIDFFGRRSEPYVEPTPVEVFHTTAEQIDLDVEGTITAGGSIIMGDPAGTELDSTGITLIGENADSRLYASRSPASMIKSDDSNTTNPATSLGPYAGIGLFEDADPNERGWVIQADGVQGGSRRGVLILRATKGGAWNPDGSTSDATAIAENNLDSTARIRLQSGESDSQMGEVQIKGEITLPGGAIDLDPGTRWAVVPDHNIKATRMGPVVYLEGHLNNNQAGNNADGATLFSPFLPVRFRPTSQRVVTVPQQTGGVWTGNARMVIETSGQVRPANGPANETGSGQHISLDGVHYTI